VGRKGHDGAHFVRHQVFRRQHVIDTRPGRRPEDALGKEVAAGSILSGSTRKAPIDRHFLASQLPFPPVFDRERRVNFPPKLGEN
jgi:hypothetical protein